MKPIKERRFPNRRHRRTKKGAVWKPPLLVLNSSLISDVMLARFRSAHDQFAAEEFLVVQLRDGAFGLVHGQHLHEGKTLRALIMFVGNDFRVLHLADAIEQLEEIALGRVEGKIADVKTRRRDFDCFGFTRWPRLLLLRRTIPSCDGRLRFSVGEKRCDFLPERFFRWRSGGRRLITRATIAPSSGGAAARTPRISPG